MVSSVDLVDSFILYTPTMTPVLPTAHIIFHLLSLSDSKFSRQVACSSQGFSKPYKFKKKVRVE
jgi:hypothetical protein